MSSDVGVVFFIGAPKKNEKPVIRVFQNLAYFRFYEFVKKVNGLRNEIRITLVLRYIQMMYLFASVLQ